jgi:beta-1,4-mannosyl-glycoprotein beta-1,4-N-acetylglucosaminyltransferase
MLLFVLQYWHQPRAITYSTPFNATAHGLRTGATTVLHVDTAWHCSWCFDSISAVQSKLSSCSHAELDTSANHDPLAILAKVRAGKDLFSHPGLEFARNTQADMPGFIQAHPSRFSYLMTRDTSDAGFQDLDQLR